METAQALKKHPLVQSALFGLLLLLFFQLLSDFVEAIYVFGLLGTDIPVEIVSVLLFLSPVVLLFLPKGLSGWPLILVGEAMLVCRVAGPMLDPRGTMLVSGLGVACALLLLPSLLRDRQDRDPGASGLDFGLGLTLALLGSILLRTWGSGSDISTRGATQIIGWVTALAAGWLLLTLHRRAPASITAGSPAEPATRPPPLSTWRTAVLCLGLVSVLVLCYFAFASPTVISRWTGTSYLPILAAVVLMLWAFGLWMTLRPASLSRLARPLLRVWNVLFAASLFLTLLSRQITFPASPAGYPLAEPPVSPWYILPLILMLLLFPVLLIDWQVLVRTLTLGRPSPRALGLGFTLGGLYLLLMVFAQVFTTVYDYIPVVGPLFRDRFAMVFLVPAVILGLALWLASRSSPAPARPAAQLGPGRVFPVLLSLLALITLAGAWMVNARPSAPATAPSALTLFTFNIQQGYDSTGRRNYEGQLDVARQFQPDIIGLQECDTARIANGNQDVVRYWADQLDYHSYYGPTTVAGTFGIALLSRYPIQNPRTFFMYSEGEQTATIEAQITVGGKTFNVFVTHLGNGGPLVQQQAILQEVRGKQNVILMGDFNFRPDTEQYRQTTALLDDSWLIKWPGGNESQGVEFARTIDHIFVSPGTRVADSRYLPGPASDHPAQMTAIEW